MSEWITGREVIKLLGIEPLELFELLKKGLQPYSQYGKKIIDSDSLPRAPRDSYEKIEANVRAKQQADTLPCSGRPKDEWEIKQIACRIYESQKPEIVNPPKDSILISLNLPINEIEAQRTINRALSFRFKKDDVLEYMNERQKDIAQAEKGFDTAVRVSEISQQIEELERMAPRNITEIDIRSRRLEELRRELEILKKKEQEEIAVEATRKGSPDSERFPKLNHEKLRLSAHKWVKDCPAVKKVVLYPGRNQGNNYVLVFVVPKILDPHNPLFQNSKEFYEQMDGTLIPFEKDLATVYKEKASIGYIQEWSSFLVDPREGIPHEFVLESFAYVLYEKEYQEELIEPTKGILANGKTPQENEQIMVFRRQGDYWLIGERGQERTLKECKGFPQLHYLLKHPGGRIPVIQVYHQGVPLSDTQKPTREDGLSDHKIPRQRRTPKRELDAYKDRIEKLSEEIALLESGKPGTTPDEILTEKEEKKDERHELESLLKQATGTFSTEEDKVRMVVRKAIKAAVEKILKECPSLETHLMLRDARNALESQKPGIITGQLCTYRPDSKRPIKWIL